MARSFIIFKLLTIVSFILLSSNSIFGQEVHVFTYTGNDQTFTIPDYVSSIKVQVWGAGGGKGSYSINHAGGAGGYAEGEIDVQTGEQYTIVVGQGGIGYGSSSNRTFQPGGPATYGGGGEGTYGDASGASGGGLSGIFSGAAKVFSGPNPASNAQSRAILVAGGGGGSTAYAGGGGAGGGNSGNQGFNSASRTREGGYGGTQSLGGTGSNGDDGRALRGGDGDSRGSRISLGYDGGGGGGGYYGGEGGYSDARPGGGGSGFLSGSVIQGSLITGEDGPSQMEAYPPMTTSTNYRTGIGVGAYASASANGGHGLVVITELCTDPNLSLSSTTLSANINDENFTLETSSSSAGTLSYSSSDESVAAINATTGEVDIIGEGTVELTVDQAAYNDYCASSAVMELTVEKIPMTVIPAAGQSKTYGSVDPTFSYTVSDPSVTFTGAMSRTAGETVGSYAYTTGTLSNDTYRAVISESAETFEITKKDLTIEGITAKDKVYDATTTAVIDQSGIVYNGLEDGDDVTASFTGVFADPNTETDKTVTLTGSVSGSDIGNYNITYQTETTATIFARIGLPSDLEYSYTGSVQSVTLQAGDYTLEAWGAQGGPGYASSVGGKGAYAKGELTLSQETTLYIYVGEQPTNNSGGWNGGGAGNINRTDNGGGGGATDFRLSGGAWDNAAGLYSRILVAAGGAGGNHAGQQNPIGGDEQSYGYSSYIATDRSAGSGAGFGYGTTVDANPGYPNGGAGGGWYGGGGLTGRVSEYRQASGGSSYAYTSSSYKPSGYTPDSSFQLSTSDLIAGNGSMPNPSGGSNTIGREGHGYAKITSKFTCTTSNLTVSSSKTVSVNDENFTLETSSSSAGTLSYSSSDESVAAINATTGEVDIIGEGTVELTVDQAAYNDYCASSAVMELTVEKIPMTVIPAAGQSKTYGSVDPTFSYTVSDPSVTFTGAMSRTAGETVGSYAYTTGTLSNDTYRAVISESAETFEITKKDLTIAGITAKDKVYDATINAVIDQSGIVYNGLEDGDDVTASFTGVFADPNTETDKTVTLTGSVSGSDIGNYNIATQATTTASIRAIAANGNNIFNFTNAGLSGRLGPTQSQIDAAYSGSNLSNAVTINTQGIQEWIVPASGDYIIEAAGAADHENRGKGAILKGKVTLTAGEVLKIVVGQRSLDRGGGGGSFVVGSPYNTTSSPLIVAGGAGGRGSGTIGFDEDKNGLTTTSGGYGGDNHPRDGKGGINGGGGGGAVSGSGGGGGGFVGNGGDADTGAYCSSGGGAGGNGADGSNGSCRSLRSGTGGDAFINGAKGGLGSDSAKNGGFGGGGGSYQWNTAGGGGGGYSGGGGGSYDDYAHRNGGGGGSYFNSRVSERSTSDGMYNGSSASITNLNNYNEGHGYVKITSPCDAPNLSLSISTLSVYGNDENFTLEPSSDSSGAFSYSSSDETVATINATTGEVDILGEGVVELTVTQAAYNYFCASSVVIELTVLNAIDISTLALKDINDYIYTGSEIIPSVEVKDGETILVQDTDYTLSYQDNTNVGTATVTVTGKGNYNGTKDVTFAITPAPLTITAEDKSKVFGEEDPELTVSYAGFVNGEDKDDLTGTLSISRASGESVSTYAITASGLTSTNYDITYTPGTFTITSRLITQSAITVSSITDLVYTGLGQTPSPEVKDGTTVLVQDTDYTLSYQDNINVGEATVTVTGTGNYNGTKDVTFAITPAPLTITAEDKSKVFGELDPELTVSYAGFVNGEDKDDLTGTLSIIRVSGESVSTYAITASGLTSTNYDITYTPGTFTITSRLITQSAITVSPITDLVYTGLGQTPSPEVKDGTTVLVEDTDYTLSYQDNINVGEATVTVTGKGNYNGTRTVTFNILKKALTISGLIADDKEYDGTMEATLSGTASLVGLVDGDDVVLSGTPESTFTSPNVSTGITVIVVGYELTGSAKDNYSLSQPTGLSADITYRVISVIPTNGLTKQYGESDPEFTYTFSGTVSGQMAAFSGSLSREQGEDVDSYQITQGSLSLTDNGSFKASNHVIVLTAGIDFEIVKAPLIVTVNNDAKFVTQADRQGYAGVSYSGFKFGEDLTSLNTTNLTITRSNAGVEAAGIYTDVLEASGITSQNYSISYEPGDYQIVAADQLYVKLADTEVVYGEDPVYLVELSGYYSSDNTQVVDLTSSTSVTGNKVTVVDGASGSAEFLIVPETPLYSTSNHLSVGTYNLVSDQAVFTSSNFNNTLIEQGILKVNPKELVVSLSSTKSKVYDGNALLPSMTFDLTTPFTGDKVSAVGTGIYESVNAGETDYRVSGLSLSGSDANNYYIQGGANAQITGTDGQISKQVLTVVPRVGQSKIFGTSDPILTYDYNGEVNGEVPVFNGSLEREVGESRGLYAISQGSLLLTDKDSFIASNYELVFTSGIDFTITNKLLSDQDISILPISEVIYNGQSQEPEVELKDIDTVLVEGVDYELSYDNNTDVGKATITITGLGNYGGVRTVTFNILPRVITVTPDSGQSKEYGESDPALTYTVSGAITGETPDFSNSLSRVQGENVGIYQITQGSLILVDNGNFKASNYEIDFTANIDFTISKASLTITVNNDSKFVTQADVVGYAGVSYSGFKFGEDQTAIDITNLSITRSNLGVEAVGVYPSVLEASGVISQNYDIVYQKGDYTIIGADQLLVKLKDSEVVYSDVPVFEVLEAGYYNSNNELIEDLTSSVQVIGTEVTVTDGTSGTAVFDIVVASPQLSSSGTLQSGSYVLESGNISKTSPNFSDTIILQGNLNVIPKELTVSLISSVTKEYDGNDNLLNLELSLTTPIDTDIVSASGAGVYESKNVGVRNYTVSGITLSGADAGNYFIQGGVNAIITGTDGAITKRALRVTPDGNQGKTFGESDPSLTYSYSGLINGEIPLFSGALGRDQGEDVGSYQIIQGDLVSQDNGVFLKGNYELVFTQGEFTIIAKSIMDADITVAPIDDYVYTGQGITPPLTVKDGATTLVQGTDYGLDYSNNINVGTSTVTIVSYGNYNGTRVVTFDIIPTPLTITADAKTKEFGEDDPELTVSYTGFVNGEDAEDLTGALSISRESGESVGSYAITASGLTSTNYAITYQEGTLTITSKSITDTDITVSPITDLVYNGSLQRPKPMVEDGSKLLEEGIDYSLSYSDNINVGQAIVTITGLGNYDGSRTVTFMIVPKVIAIIIPDQEKDYGAQDPVLVFTADPVLFGSDEFTGALSRESGEAVGDYLITSGTLSAGSNYSLDIQTDAIFSIIRIDSDGDGVADDIEESDGTDPFDFCSSIPSNITLPLSQDFLNGDCDGDGLNNGDEIGPDVNNPLDSDGDGVFDYLEFNNYTPSIEDDLEVFNLLTPNGDGDNDVFVIRNIELYPENTLEIYNRWGVLVYSVSGYGQNGRYFRGVSNNRRAISKSSLLPTGTYFYILRYNPGSGDFKERKGYLYLTR